jgi:hypothetical protein
MKLKRTIQLAVLATACVTFADLAKADTCSPIFGTGGPTCFTGTDVVYLYYGTLTLLSPDGTLISTTNLETAETGLGDLFNSVNTQVPNPAGEIALFPTLVPQLQSDPQSTFANLPSWALTNLDNLADANGFGFVQDPTAPLNEPPDPAVVAFETQLANVGGPFTTISDTGFGTQPFSLADCEYDESFLHVTLPCVPTPGVSQYEFTYQLGPYLNDGNTYTSFVNFQIYSRDVTEQLVATTPEPEMVVPLGVGFVVVGLLRRQRAKRASR